MPTLDELIAAFPEALQPEFVMTVASEPIRLWVGTSRWRRGASDLGTFQVELSLVWNPNLHLQCVAQTPPNFGQFFGIESVSIEIPQLGFTSEAHVVHVGSEIILHLFGADNPTVQGAERFRFYLVNFQSLWGQHIRRAAGGVSRGRLRMTAGSVVCTVDEIEGMETRINRSQPGYWITHVGEVTREGAAFSTTEVHRLLDMLYWLFAFLHGARTGPILPSIAAPFSNSWISIQPWSIDEYRRVESWLPEHSVVNADALFTNFLAKWAQPDWNEALRTTIAWYVSANATRTTSEARVSLCQIALEVLASLHGLEVGKAHVRLRELLKILKIPVDVPTRLTGLSQYAGNQKDDDGNSGIDAPAALTRVRNKLEHPTSKNRTHMEAVDGLTRMQAAQYGLELFELCLLATMGYAGKFCQRAFQGWKGQDEVPVPWL